MARSRISAFFMNDDEKKEALRIMGAATETDSFIYGEVDDADISKLKEAGIIVQPQIEAPMKLEEPTEGTPQGMMLRRREAAIIGMDVNPAPTDYYTIALRGPIIERWREQLASMGVTLLEALPSGGYKVCLDLSVVPRVKALDYVASLDWIPPTQSAATTVTQSVGAPAIGGPSPAGVKMLTFDVRLNLPDDRPKIEEWLKKRNLAISGSSGRKIRFFALENAPELNELATQPEVDTIAEYVPPKLANDVARVLLGVDSAVGNPAPVMVIQLDGTGQTVAVADTGIDDLHPDFQGRIVGKVARGRPGVTNDPHGHGTHVSGSVLGNGTASNGKVRGVAPKAQLFFQSLLDANGGLGGLPLDLNDLFNEAYQAGARIHNNSWGAETSSKYTINSEEVDEFVRSNPDMLIVIAAGNAGSGAQPFKAAQGFVDWLSIGSPASSKNALTVGASRSSRGDGPMAKTTWGAAWPASFPFPPISQETISGKDECLAAFSGRGPCDDHRIKPDVVAPGTDIASTRSSLAPISNFWGMYPTPPAQPVNPNYAYDGGTSMATPLVSGCAALIRQYYVDTRGHNRPSAALLKATIINSTTWLQGVDSLAPEVGIPNYHQGHGRVSMLHAIPNSSDPNMALQFIDDWQNAQVSLTRTGDRRRYHFVLPQGTPELRLCLAYTDVPARALQNNLNLIVQHQESNTKWTGNSSLPGALTLLDTTNNVEIVRIPNPPAGNYFVQIVASNILKPPQDFALVLTGAAIPPLTQIT